MSALDVRQKARDVSTKIVIPPFKWIRGHKNIQKTVNCRQLSACWFRDCSGESTGRIDGGAHVLNVTSTVMLKPDEAVSQGSIGPEKLDAGKVDQAASGH